MKRCQTIKWQAKGQKGQTIVEILIAMAIVTVVMVAVVSRAVEAVKASQFARNKSLATRYAQEGVEWMRSQRDRLAWGGLAALLPTGVLQEYCVPDILATIESLTVGVCGSGDVITGTEFIRQVDLTRTAGGGEGDFVSVVVEVTWTDNIGDHSATLDTRLSEWIP